MNYGMSVKIGGMDAFMLNTIVQLIAELSLQIAPNVIIYIFLE
jgi:hypothetical protein